MGVQTLGKLFNQETAGTIVRGGLQAAKAIKEMARALEREKSDLESLAPILSRINTVLDWLNSPLAEIVQAGIPFASMATQLLDFYMARTKKIPSSAGYVALASQLAYLDSLQEMLAGKTIKDSKTNKNNQLLKELDPKLRALADLTLDDEEAKQTLLSFRQSKLGNVFTEVLLARFASAQIDENEAKTLAKRVLWNTQSHLAYSLTKFNTKIQLNLQTELEKHNSIKRYLEDRIRPLPLARIFNESFLIEDIHVDLKVMSGNSQVNPLDRSEPIEVVNWALSALNDPQQKDSIMFIQGGPGSGKSVFCKTFANWVGRNLHPIWTPIFVSLRDVDTFEQSFDRILTAAVRADFVQSDKGWLCDANTRFLFILDGFDELGIPGASNNGLESFFRMAASFQSDCKLNEKEMGHRILITGRTMALQGIERLLPIRLTRARILPLDQQQQMEWVKKWTKLTSSTSIDDLLNNPDCPHEILELAREPLLLFLLAAMCRDSQLNTVNQEAESGIEGRILIYKQAMQWALTNRPLPISIRSGMSIPHQILMETGLCVVQSGGQHTCIGNILERLGEDQRSPNMTSDLLHETLRGLYFQPVQSDLGNAVEFTHSSFGEFHFAERVTESLEEWTEDGRRPGRRFNIVDEECYKQVFDLLGYGALTSQLVEYILSMFQESNLFRPVELSERLRNFYSKWVEGKFINSTGANNVVQQKMLNLNEMRRLNCRTDYIGLREVDIYTGLNVMILLLEIYRWGRSDAAIREKLAFYPSGRKSEDDYDQGRLRRIIGYSDCVRLNTFSLTVGPFLRHARLNELDLRGINLSGVDLSYAHLSHTNLSGADLSGANLNEARLAFSSLQRANLEGASLVSAFASNLDLSNATLSRARLDKATLSGAWLTNANLVDASLERAYLGGAELADANLARASLRGTILCGANMSGAQLSGVDLSDADLRGVRRHNITSDWKTQW